MGFVVDTDAMREHAADVDERARELREATEAAEHTMLVDDSFGLLCAFYIPMALTMEVGGVATTHAAAAAMGGVSCAIKGAASGYETLDDGLGGLLSKILELI